MCTSGITQNTALFVKKIKANKPIHNIFQWYFNGWKQSCYFSIVQQQKTPCEETEKI